METAAKDASDLQGSAQAGQVNKIKMTKSKQNMILDWKKMFLHEKN
jgi:hypothetical protein